MGECLFADRMSGHPRAYGLVMLGDDVAKLGTKQKLSKRNGSILPGNVRSHWSSSFLQKKQGGEKNTKNKNVMLKYYRKTQRGGADFFQSWLRSSSANSNKDALWVLEALMLALLGSKSDSAINNCYLVF